MWPMLLNMTRDDCRRTLRRLELEAYSNMISVLRAQGGLEENRKKLLEELRGVLHISGDRHSAEARRAANDELLATIAEQLAGPNTGLAWISEGRRRVPLMPRGIAQTAYTEIADKAALEAIAENKVLQEKLEAQKLVSPKSIADEEMPEAEGETAEEALSSEPVDELMYPPVVTEDPARQLQLEYEEEQLGRKRKGSESAEESASVTPMKNVRNTTHNSNQKHLNLSQIYSNYSKTPAGKSSSQSKHSYNQVSKVSSKSNQAATPRSTKHKPHKTKNPIVISKSQMKKSLDLTMQAKTGHNQTGNLEYMPGSFQASYAQSLQGYKKSDFDDQSMTTPPHLMDSPAMQLLAQPATVPHEIGVTELVHSEDQALQAQGTSATKHKITGRASQQMPTIKKNESSIETPKTRKIKMSDFKILQKPSDSIKVLQNRQIVMAPSTPKHVGPQHMSMQHLGSSSKVLATKIVSTPKSLAPVVVSAGNEKMVFVSNSQTPQRTMGNAKNILITSSSITTPVHKDTVTVDTNHISPKTADDGPIKSLPTAEMKLGAKTILLNAKSGQKMVVLPGKARTKTVDGQTMPLLHLKGMPPTMKLVPMSSHPTSQMTRTNPITLVSKPTMVNTITSTSNKLVTLETVKTANMADITPPKIQVQGISTTPKSTSTIVRPAGTKGNVIVVQKGTSLGKINVLSRNGNDMSKIIMSKNSSQLLQASKEPDTTKSQGNVIILDLNTDQITRPTTVSEILDNRNKLSSSSESQNKTNQSITQDTPVLFDNPISEEACNASSLDSVTGSSSDIMRLEDSAKQEQSKSTEKESDSAKDTSSVTDWEMELDSVSTKNKDDDDKLDSLHLELGMSSDSDTDSYLVDSKKNKSKKVKKDEQPSNREESRGIFSGSPSLSQAGRTLLSQLQDDGSSSNDSSFTLKTKLAKEQDSKLSSTSERDTKTQDKKMKTITETKPHQKRSDIYSSAITSADIRLDSFEYLEENMMAGDDMFATDTESKKSTKDQHLEMQLRQLLGETGSPGAHTVSQSLPLNK